MLLTLSPSPSSEFQTLHEMNVPAYGESPAVLNQKTTSFSLIAVCQEYHLASACLHFRLLVTFRWYLHASCTSENHQRPEEAHYNRSIIDKRFCKHVDISIVSPQYFALKH